MPRRRPTAEPLVAGWWVADSRSRGLAGRVGCAGGAVNPQAGPAAGGCAFGRLRSNASQAKRTHPCRLGRATHGAYAPAQPTRPATDSFRTRSPRKIKKNQIQKPVASLASTHGVDLPCRHGVDASCRPRSTATNSKDAPRSVRGGAVWACRTVGAMDGAIEPPWMGLRRVLQAHTAPPNRTAQPPLLILTLPLPLPLLLLAAGPGPQARAENLTGRRAVRHRAGTPTCG